MTIAPVRKRGKIAYFVAVKQDETDRWEAERAREFLASIVEASEDAIIGGTLENTVASWNRGAQKLFGYHPQEIIGKHLSTIVPPESHSNFRAVQAELRQGRSVPAFEGVALRKDGTKCEISIALSPLLDREQRVVATAGIIRDISERKRVEENLRRSEERASQLAREAIQLTELVDLLQSCQKVEEAYRVVEGILRTALVSRGGALCITSSSRNVVEAMAVWGESLATDKTFRADDCWALRRGKVHEVSDAASPFPCTHVPPGGFVCVPLAAQGETLGVLYLEAQPEASQEARARQMEALTRQGSAAGERISLALANIRLREALRSQSIRGPWSAS